jgi:hypothetical protein
MSGHWESAAYGGQVLPCHPGAERVAVEVLLRDRRSPLPLRLRLLRLESHMTNTFTRIPITTNGTVPAHRPPAAPAGELARMSDAELVALRRALARGLGQLRLGSRPSLLLGRLSRQARAELRRRERHHEGPPRAA